YPVRAAVLSLLLLSLAGLPATAGFMAKLAIFQAALQAGFTGLVIIGIIASLLSFAFYLRVILVLYQKDDQTETEPWHVGSTMEHVVLAVCASGVLLLGLLPGALFDLIQQILP
ncbi:MAG: proton-conducting transporter membrane subunit, partial [Desulfuromonadales bacterium]|nr:proton-conducting transporter membrane subunit [Desulfuromonadales bacterium]